MTILFGAFVAWLIASVLIVVPFIFLGIILRMMYNDDKRKGVDKKDGTSLW